MQRFSAQDITFNNYKEKLHSVIRNCKQHEITQKQGGIAQQQKRNLSRSNSREKQTTPNSCLPTNKKKVMNTGKVTNLKINTSYHDSQTNKLLQTKQPITQKARSNSFAEQTINSQTLYLQSGPLSVHNNKLSAKRQLNQSGGTNYKNSSADLQNNYLIQQLNQASATNFSDFFKQTNQKEIATGSPQTQIQQLKELLNQREKNPSVRKLQVLNFRYDQTHTSSNELVNSQSKKDLKYSEKDKQQEPEKGKKDNDNEILSARRDSVFVMENEQEANHNRDILDFSSIQNTQTTNQIDHFSNQQANISPLFSQSRIAQCTEQTPIQLSASQININTFLESSNQNCKDRVKLNETIKGNLICFKEALQQSSKVVIPKIRNFDQIVEEKNQQMEYEIPPHVYNQTFQGEEGYSSSSSVSEIIEFIASEEKEQHFQSSQDNPVLGLKNIIKTMEIGGKEGDIEVKQLKITIRKLQYRDAVLRQKIASMISHEQEKDFTIQELEQELNELKIREEEKNIIIESMTERIDNLVNERKDQNQKVSDQINKFFEELDLKNGEIAQLKSRWNDEKALLEEEIVNMKNSFENERKQQQNEICKQREKFNEEMTKQELACLERLAEFQERNLALEDKYSNLQNQSEKDEDNQVNFEKFTLMEEENLQLKKDLFEFKEQKEWLEDVLKSYLLSRELEKMKDGQIEEEDEEEDEEYQDNLEQQQISSQRIGFNEFSNSQEMEEIRTDRNLAYNNGEVQNNNYLETASGKTQIKSSNQQYSQIQIVNQNINNLQNVKQTLKNNNFNNNFSSFNTFQNNIQVPTAVAVTNNALSNINHPQTPITEINNTFQLTNQKININQQNPSTSSYKDNYLSSANLLKEVNCNTQQSNKNNNDQNRNINFNNIQHIIIPSNSNYCSVPSSKNEYQSNSLNQIGKENNYQSSGASNGSINNMKQNLPQKISQKENTNFNRQNVSYFTNQQKNQQY